MNEAILLVSSTGYTKHEYITDIGLFQCAQSTDILVFNFKDISFYKKAFLELQSKQLIVNKAFDDGVWILLSSEFQTSIHFRLEKYPEMELLLKCFTVIGLTEGHDQKYTQFRVKHLKECIIQCQGFTCEVHTIINHFERWVMYKSKPTLSRLKPVVEQFLGFSNFNFTNELLHVLDGFSSSVRGIRSLPDFKDTLIFDFIINDLQKTWSSYEKLVFYPILLWWRITLLIPMRVVEFCSLKYDCVTTDSSNKFYMKVPRKKVRAHGNAQIDIVDVLEINHDVVELISEYKEITKGFRETPYLLSYDAYCESFRVKQCYGARSKKINMDTFGNQQLKRLITLFYDDIVVKKYGYMGLERINPMDTRHFAFCNMMLQGFNMLTIARIGGHTSLNAQMHYFSHLDRLSQSSVQYLAEVHQKFGSIQSKSATLGDQERVLRAKSVLRNYSEEELNSFYPMEFGYCTVDPHKCPVGDCRHCPHLYIPEQQFSDSTISWLTDESDRLKARIKEQLELMRTLTRNMTYNFSTFEFDPLAQAELSYLASNSSKLREQKAQTDAKINLIYKGWDEFEEKSW